MQVDHHIRACPVIREAAGEEPYPQPSVIFTTAPSGTVSVRIYDFSVSPPVELTSTALSGAELSAPTLAGLSNNYTLDMGHANVTAVIDAYASEGLECVVAFQDSGTAADRYVKVTCNDADHIAALYPEQAIYAVSESGNTGTSFPVGSTYLPAEDIGDACSVLTSRGSAILDCAGAWNSGPSGSGGVLAADVGTALATAKALVRTRSTASWAPHNTNDVINLVDCQVVSVNVPYGFTLGNYSNGTYFGGTPSLVNCRLAECYWTGNGSSRSGGFNTTNCKFEDDQHLVSYQTPGCWATTMVGCINGGDIVLDCSSMNGYTVSMVDCSGGWQIDNLGSGKTVDLQGVKGMPDIVLDSSTNSAIDVIVTGAYNRLVNNTGGALTSLTERKLAGYSDLTGNVVNLAAGSVTATEAPNLDAPISTRATQAQILSDATPFPGASVTEARLAELDAANLPTDVAANGAALASAAGDITTLLSRLGANDMAILKGLSLGNYRLDGGAGNASAQYDANGCMTSGRVRAFASSAAAAAATAGAADGADSEIARVDITATAVSGQPYPASVVGQLT